MEIDGRIIGCDQPPYLIAEISCNHNGKLDTALKLIRAAKDAGADAVKFQAYEAEDMTIDHASAEFVIQDGQWAGRTLHEIYRKSATPFDWFPTIFGHARSLGITPFASVFSRRSVDLLESLQCPAYKIASMEITDLPLIEYVASKGKPLILSTGMASETEINEAVQTVYDPYMDVAILACTSAYPAGLRDAPLWYLQYILSTPACSSGDWYAGISDHTADTVIPVAATAMGAQIIEKHLMLGDENTEDFLFSATPGAFQRMAYEVRSVWSAIQNRDTSREEPTRQMRRSLYVIKDIKAGEPFTEANVKSIRPSYGLAPRELPWVLTKCAAHDLKRGHALQQADLAP